MLNKVKHSILLFLLPLLWVSNLHAAYYSFIPYRITQPDKRVLDCFISGDEYFNWLHDANGYTLMQSPDGYYCYATKSAGELKPSIHIAGRVNPAQVGLVPWLKISDQDYVLRKSAFRTPDLQVERAPSSGTINNLVIYIRFADDPEFSMPRQIYEDKFNQTPGESLKSYYSEASYNKLTINSTHYPACPGNSNLSYRNFHPRAYYQPYNATTNPQGYSNDGERINREHTLLKNAIEWISINSAVPASLTIDGDNDGNIDNVSFIIQGSCGAWSQLLWAHNWQLFSYNTLLNGKRVWQYTLEPELQTDVRTLCHEMFHSLGAPDLYHYNSDGIHPVGAWDIMDDGSGHMSAWMKYRYLKQAWITEIPLISSSGTYVLNPLSSPENNCFRIASPNSSSEFFVIEYRKTEGLYESKLPGSGLLVYRIDTLVSGNAGGPPDEVYVYRPNGTRSLNGSPSNAYYVLETGRTAINDATNPACFLQNGESGGLQLYDIGTAGSTISFSVYINPITPPVSFEAIATSSGSVLLNWQKNLDNHNVLLVQNTADIFGTPINGAMFETGMCIPGGGEVLYSGSAEEFIHTGLNNNSRYYYRLYSVTNGFAYSNAEEENAITQCGVYSLPFNESFNGSGIPDCWSLQHEGAGAIDNWDVPSTNNAGGSGNELRSTFQQVNPGISRIVSPGLNTIGIAKLNLSFRTTLDDWASGTVLRIQSSTDGLSWTNEAWTMSTSSNNTIGPFIIHTTVLHNLDSPHTYLAFAIEGNLYKYDFWYIDDVILEVAEVLPVGVTLTGNPPEGGSVSGGGTYFFNEPVNIAATPSPGWQFLNWTEGESVVSNHAMFTLPAATRALVANFSKTQANIVLTCVASNGGITQGSGIYPLGSAVTVHAIKNNGYVFNGWSCDGNPVSASSTYTFTTVASIHLVANFNPIETEYYQVSVEANHDQGGGTSGGGNYAPGGRCTVYANPFAGWIFDYWKENGEIVSYRPVYDFTVEGDHDLTAIFREEISVFTSVFPTDGGLISGGGSYYSGDIVSCRAMCNKEWRFEKWTLNGLEISSDSVYSFVATADCRLEAVFIAGVGKPEQEIADINIYPNPCRGKINIECPSNETLREISIFNNLGQVVLNSTFLSNQNQLVTDISTLAPGNYFVRLIATSGKEWRRKILVLNGS